MLNLNYFPVLTVVCLSVCVRVRACVLLVEHLQEICECCVCLHSWCQLKTVLPTPSPNQAMYTCPQRGWEALEIAGPLLSSEFYIQLFGC
jgi:hypothetical protein